MIYNIQAPLNPRCRLVIDLDARAAFWKKLNEEMDLSLQIFLIHYISW